MRKCISLQKTANNVSFAQKACRQPKQLYCRLVDSYIATGKKMLTHTYRE